MQWQLWQLMQVMQVMQLMQLLMQMSARWLLNSSGLQRAWVLLSTRPSLAIDLRAQYKQVLEPRDQDSARSKTPLIMDRLRSLPTYLRPSRVTCVRRKECPPLE